MARKKKTTNVKDVPSVPEESRWKFPLSSLSRPPAAFTKALAREIVRNISTLGEYTARPFRRVKHEDTAVIPSSPYSHPVLVDTSILIDGRIVGIAKSGFLTGTLLIPQFVLSELQHIADSAESLRRAKGRRGLDVVSQLQEKNSSPELEVRIIADDLPAVTEVDSKLVELAQKYKKLGVDSVRLLTVDYNLAKLAGVRGVRVLSVHELAKALRVSLIAGEEITLKITHEGKERTQGVGYLEDGTMVVVEDAKDKVGRDIAVVLTKVHQTPAGQLFFAKLQG